MFRWIGRISGSIVRSNSNNSNAFVVFNQASNNRARWINWAASHPANHSRSVWSRAWIKWLPFESERHHFSLVTGPLSPSMSIAISSCKSIFKFCFFLYITYISCIIYKYRLLMQFNEIYFSSFLLILFPRTNYVWSFPTLEDSNILT